MADWNNRNNRPSEQSAKCNIGQALLSSTFLKFQYTFKIPVHFQYVLKFQYTVETIRVNEKVFKQ